jgi:hypothetical protein
MHLQGEKAKGREREERRRRVERAIGQWQWGRAI